MTFLALHAQSGVSMCRSDLKPSPACSPFNSEQDRVFLLYPVAIFSIRSARGVARISLRGDPWPVLGPADLGGAHKFTMLVVTTFF